MGSQITQTLSNTVFNIKKTKTFIWLYLYPVVASDVSSDDEPLIKLKKKAATAERPERKVNKSTRSTGTNEKKAGTLSTTCQQVYSSCVVWFLPGIKTFFLYVTFRFEYRCELWQWAFFKDCHKGVQNCKEACLSASKKICWYKEER